MAYGTSTALRSEVVSPARGAPVRAYAKSHGDYCKLDAPARHRLPLSCVTVVFTLDHWILAANGQPPLIGRSSFVRGLSPAMAIAQQDADARSLWLHLTPLDAAALFGVGGAALRDRVLPLEALLGREADTLTAHLFALPPGPLRRMALEAWLRARIAPAPKPRPDVVWAWRELTARGGDLSIKAVIGRLGCSRRHLAQRFSEVIGMTPKAYGRLVRFERAISSLLLGEEDLGAIALDCGYYDQAHFNRDVRAFAGMSPTKLQAERLAGGSDLDRLEFMSVPDGQSHFA